MKLTSFSTRIATISLVNENGRSPVLFGLQYHPEVVFDIGASTFIALGIVLNYSWGELATGVFEVDNGRTAYAGNAAQRLAKSGITFRLGWDTRSPNERSY